MNLGYEVAAELPALRAQAESTMCDTCAITGEPITRVWDEETASYVDAPTVVYTGKCEVKAQDVEAAVEDAQGQLLVVQSLILKLPVAASANVAPGNVAILSACLFDPQLVGKKLRVGAAHHQSYATARRLPVKEIS